MERLLNMGLTTPSALLHPHLQNVFACPMHSPNRRAQKNANRAVGEAVHRCIQTTVHDTNGV